MSGTPSIVLPHGSYKNLKAYQKSDIVYKGTVLFCHRFLKQRDRTVDQMVQAARSCKQNIVEGSMASGTSKETELKLVNVACASIEELLEDYEDWLRTHGAEKWPFDDPRTTAARNLGRAGDWEAGIKPLFESRPPETVCNLQICFIHQTKHLLDRLIGQQEEDFKKHGGLRERMHAARTATRGEEWEKVIFSRLYSSSSPDELRARIGDISSALARTERNVKARKGWH